MKPTDRPIFLEQHRYRIRRLIDALRLLPILGAFLWFLPAVWALGPNAPLLSVQIIYIFIVWLVLIIISVVISARLKRTPDLWDTIERVQDLDD